jgi:hypothetical protein
MNEGNRRCCGMDIHKDTIVVCVLPPVGGEGQTVRKTYGSFRNDLIRMRVWLKQLKVTEIAIAYASHCTSLGRCDTFSTCKSLFDNLAQAFKPQLGQVNRPRFYDADFLLQDWPDFEDSRRPAYPRWVSRS